MNLFEFNTDKMEWQKIALTGNPGSMYAKIRITDDEYFKECIQVFRNIVNTTCKFIVIDHTNNKSFYCVDMLVEGWDFVNNIPNISTLTKEDVSITIQLKGAAGTFTDLNNYWLYLQYE